MLRRAVISRKVLLVLALSRQFWLCSVYFSIRNPFIVANCIEERASRLDGEVLAGVLFGRSGGFPRPQNVLSIEESRGHLDVDDDTRLEALMSAATATPKKSNALSASTATLVKSNLPSASTATLEVEPSVGVDVIGDGDSDEVERSVGVGDSDDDVER
jgi:hypothetical protein